GDEALDHDREDVLAPDEAAVEERQAGCHEHDQAAAEQHEARVAGVEMKHRAASWSRCRLSFPVPIGPGPIMHERLTRQAYSMRMVSMTVVMAALTTSTSGSRTMT